MRNRHGDEYTFEQVNQNTYTIVGDLKYWRFGGQEGQETIDYENLGFVDPSGGPFIGIGSKIENRKVIRISCGQSDDRIMFHVE